MRCKKLLLLYTCGTIGMQMGADGLAPATGFEARVRAQQALTPASEQPQWIFRELLPPIDSANMAHGHWLAMVEMIRAGVEDDGCDAVLLLQGTDTLAYSAAALSFLLLGLPVPVLLTGAMLPAGAEGSDAWSNLFGAMDALQQGLVSGVQLYFYGQLLPGARARQCHTEAFDAFRVLPRQRHGAPATELSARLDYRQPRQAVNLAVLPLFPGIQATHVRAPLRTRAAAGALGGRGGGGGPG